MKKIGIMGGTFNPIHLGHIEIAKAAYEQYKLDEVWFMPNHIPGYKPGIGVVSGEHRLKMASLAIDGYDHFAVSDFELLREGKTYSYETFTKLKEIYPDCYFFFIMGADSLFYFDKWVKPEVILRHTDVLVASRDNNGVGEIIEKIKEMDTNFGKGHFSVIKCNNVDCSSSRLREYIYKTAHPEGVNNMDYIKEYICRYLPGGVYEYIKEKELYI